MPKIEFGPEAFHKAYSCVLVTLPEHEIGQSLDTGGTDEEVQRWIVCGVHV